ncbi:hypothetical protein G5I_07785 [Acromyrmex echinatior]|uniref:Uncharacterized protein n=1 Tax=Acromyrmex echinatior TaxID=103372 RepID=F4WPQ9_ACREC|nr:hypothetical protein G5I_07785 [Acromyrmex echinatior]
MIFVHFLDAYKGKSWFVLEFKRALIVEMRELLLENEEKAEARLSRSFLRDVGNSLPRNHYRVSTKREMATAQSENHITRVITILISRGMIGRDVNARPVRMPVYLAGREEVCEEGEAKVGDGTESKLPVAAKPPR